MDIVDYVTYKWADEQVDIDNLAEATSRAFKNVFDVGSSDAKLVAKFLVGVCKWEDEMECNDPIINAKYESLRGVIRQIKKQINK